MTFCIAIPGINKNAAKNTMRLWDKSLKKNGIAVTHYGCGDLSYENGPAKQHMVLLCKTFAPIYAIYKRNMRGFMKEVDYDGLKCLMLR